MKHIRIGTRQSRLALVQANMVASWLRAQHKDLEVEIVGMTTVGDQILDKKLDKIGGKGLFIKELEVALLNGQIDVAVHSAKDLPAQIAQGLRIVAVSKREDPRDALITRHEGGFWELPSGSIVGTSSARRESQLRMLRSDLDIRMLRGNVLTRLDKLKANLFDAIVLASAGLTRLGLAQEVSYHFESAQMVPAVGQGILAIEANVGFEESIFAGFHDAEAALCLSAERAAMLALDGDCSVPLGVHATCGNSGLSVCGFYGMQGRNARVNLVMNHRDPLQCGQDLAKSLLAAWESV